ncbi:MAG: nucleotide exchange factor GrpE [Beggiatoa sp. IS2]|nr:MAG: nucleotide exchange factor GrpE [Beggiatoa sp. IS2]
MTGDSAVDAPTSSTFLSKEELAELRKESDQWSPVAVKMLDSYEKLYHELASTMQKVETYWDGLLRQRAETDNLHKRMQRDVENARKYALEKFATELLPVKDSIELGLEAVAKPETDLNAIRDGMTLTLKMLATLLEKFNIAEINPQDQKFNPQWHEAMALQPLPNVEDGTVVYVHQKGYQLNDRLLRPARVIVAKTLEPEKPLESQG